MKIAFILDKKVNSDHKRLLENFVSLSVLQGLNYILPLITFPYLVRVLGVEKFGLLAFATATIGYFQIIADYGFNLSATRQISISREDKEKVQEIFSAVMIIKLGLMILSFILLSVLVFSFDKFRQDWEVYFFTFGMVIGNILLPVWFFQGIEKMKYITVLNVLSRGFFTLAIFLFVKEEGDFLLVPLINSMGFLFTGILSFIIIRQKFSIEVKLASKSMIIYQLKEGWHIFVSTIAISLYTISTTFILGIFTNTTIVGYYAAVDRIIQAIKGLMTPFSQTLYPYINKKVAESKEIGLRIIKKVIKVVFILTGIISLNVFIFADDLVRIILGEGYDESIVVLKILSIHPLLIGLSNIFGIQTMLSFGKNTAFKNILLSASILNLILSFVLVPLYQHIGSSLAVTMVEFFVTAMMFIYLQKSGIKIVRFRDV